MDGSLKRTLRSNVSVFSLVTLREREREREREGGGARERRKESKKEGGGRECGRERVVREREVY